MGHGKSDLALSFLEEKGLDPYIITMGSGMTTDRLFGGIDLPKLDATGKLEYLVENSFMNYENVIFEELFDSPDYILEQLKDILSSKKFRNGTQEFDIKTKRIICCTNKTREEFSKNASLKALMERFPLEFNVIWDNYTDISYNKLLETKFGENRVDPMIPFLLSQYHKEGITISPRIAVIAYEIFEQCGPEALMFIAEFAKKPNLIAESVKKFEATIKFRQIAGEITELSEQLNTMDLSSSAKKQEFNHKLAALVSKLTTLKNLPLSDSLIGPQTTLIKKTADTINVLNKKLQVNSFVEDSLID